MPETAFAIIFWIIWWCASVLPKLSRVVTYSRHMWSARSAQPSQRMQCVSRAGTRRACARRKPSPTSPRTASFSDADAVEAHLGLAVLEDGRAHHRDVAHVLDALGVAIDDEHRRAARAVVGRARHHDEERRVAAAGRVPLVSVDDPAVAVLAGGAS